MVGREYTRVRTRIPTETETVGQWCILEMDSYYANLSNSRCSCVVFEQRASIYMVGEFQNQMM